MSDLDFSDKLSPTPFQVHGALTLSPVGHIGNRGLLNDRRLQLLEHIGQSGSIAQAAKLAGFSYKGAWDAVDALNSLFDKPLVQKTSGGKGGGGAQLTDQGIQLLDASRVLRQAHQKFLETASMDIAQYENVYQWMRKMTVKTSARNQWFGTVIAIKQAAVNVEVSLQLTGGAAIHAVITRDSLEALALQVGCEAWALVKASWIMLATPEAAHGLSARNKLTGTVAHLRQGGVNSEIGVRCAGGNLVVATVTNESVSELRLAVGQSLVTCFKASSVILGVNA